MINADSATDKGDDGFALVAPLNDQLVCELCGDCTLDAHEDEDGWLVLGHTLYLCEGCQRGYHSHCIQARVGPAAASFDRSLSDVSWSDPALVERWSTWRCGECVEDDRWGVRSLGESMLMFGSARCSARSAAYSVLTYFHTDTRLPEAFFLHGRQGGRLSG